MNGCVRATNIKWDVFFRGTSSHRYSSTMSVLLTRPGSSGSSDSSNACAASSLSCSGCMLVFVPLVFTNRSYRAGPRMLQRFRVGVLLKHRFGVCPTLGATGHVDLMPKHRPTHQAAQARWQAIV